MDMHLAMAEQRQCTGSLASHTRCLLAFPRKAKSYLRRMRCSIVRAKHREGLALSGDENVTIGCAFRQN